ncbi:MAG: siderophore-interacting protein [Pseudonocardiaceae bacterium]|nr:siderophore-interacting protein [Pseudonocardiaceae bacterium]
MRPDGGARRRTASTAAVVASVTPLTPRMTRIRLTGHGLHGIGATPGQTVKLLVPGPDTGAPVSRDYTVRGYDDAAATMDIDFVLHGDGPAATWARRAEAGQTLEFVGPSGRYWPDPTADWLLFVGDETAMPAMLAMVESLPEHARAYLYLEVADAAEEQPVGTAARPDVRWLHRGDADPGTSTVLEDAVQEAALPPGHGRIWVAGHTPTVHRIRAHLLEARGIDRRDLYVRGFWGTVSPARRSRPTRAVGSGR